MDNKLLNMMRRLKKVISYYLSKKKSFEEFKIAGVSLKGLKGTENKNVDYKDAWFFAFAKNAEIVFNIGSNIYFKAFA